MVKRNDIQRAAAQIELAKAVPDARIGTKAVMALADISRPTLYRWIKLGQFPAPVAPGKWRGADILGFLAQTSA
jgi:predicted DNA-binding transcriptional regulator AlpA